MMSSGCWLRGCCEVRVRVNSVGFLALTCSRAISSFPSLRGARLFEPLLFRRVPNSCQTTQHRDQPQLPIAATLEPCQPQMPFESHGRAAFASNSLAAATSTTSTTTTTTTAAMTTTGPPPSTLAAQLVENISASATAKSSRPDETTELKRLFATIERVKNDPACLRTHDERVEHNHLLVYVCGGVFLESLKLDDAFADRERLRANALRAVQFLRVTVRETPTVLRCVTDGRAFLRRGPEPLWVWILPRLLRMLGHRRCVGIAGEIEELCRDVLLLAAGDAGLWDVGRGLMAYFRASLGGELGRTFSSLTIDGADFCCSTSSHPHPIQVDDSVSTRDIRDQAAARSFPRELAYWYASRVHLQLTRCRTRHPACYELASNNQRGSYIERVPGLVALLPEFGSPFRHPATPELHLGELADATWSWSGSGCPSGRRPDRSPCQLSRSGRSALSQSQRRSSVGVFGPFAAF